VKKFLESEGTNSGGYRWNCMSVSIVSMKDFTITDMDIQALIDEELSPQRKQVVMEAIYRSPELSHRYTLYMHQKKLLKCWWKDN
jgi:hypothetical protein